MTKVKAKRKHKLSKIVSRPRRRGKIWVMAVDPFGDRDLAQVWNLVTPLAEKSGAEVQAAYVLAPSSMNWTGDFSGPWMKRYFPIAEKKMAEILPSTVKINVIQCHNSGLRYAVKALIAFAKRVDAECLVISTHGRKGIARVALGSFAETVILTSKIPVLILNPEVGVPSEVHKILVPTDLSKKSEKFVANVADYAKNLNAEIVLYHKQPDPLDPIIQQGVYSLGGGWVSVQNFIDDEWKEKNRKIMKLEALVSRRKVPVSHVVDSSPGGLIESIEKAAKENGVDMVSVLTQSGSWSAALLGSVARGLVRSSPVPVLVQR